MRQSEGNKTVKRLSAIAPDQMRFTLSESVSEAIEGPATPALAWLARILSSLLLKTASVLPASLQRDDFAIAATSITADAALGNATPRVRCWRRQRSANIG